MKRHITASCFTVPQPFQRLGANVANIRIEIAERKAQHEDADCEHSGLPMVGELPTKRRDSELAFLPVAALMPSAGATLDKQVSSGRMRVHFAHTARYSGHLEQLVEEQL
jgi:hypothetical protein